MKTILSLEASDIKKILVGHFINQNKKISEVKFQIKKVSVGYGMGEHDETIFAGATLLIED